MVSPDSTSIHSHCLEKTAAERHRYLPWKRKRKFLWASGPHVENGNGSVRVSPEKEHQEDLQRHHIYEEGFLQELAHML